MKLMSAFSLVLFSQLSLSDSFSIASFPGPTQLFVAFRTANDGKLGGAWEQGYFQYTLLVS